jgi:hypothetical protein
MQTLIFVKALLALSVSAAVLWVNSERYRAATIRRR